MNKQLAQVKEFNDAFETSKDPQLWVKLVAEELTEAKEAAAHLLKELCDIAYVEAGLVNLVGEEEAQRLLDDAGIGIFPETVMELLDVFDRQEVLEEAFDRVHASNMSKLGHDGKPVRRQDGKVLKGPNYQPPVLDDLIA
jgi:predicted HAD superfamily Cof-like phosphohydrolase